MDNRIEMRQDIYWNGNTMITEIVGKIAGDMEKKREETVLNHFETDYTELREFLEAKRKGTELVPVVRCKKCVRRYDPNLCPMCTIVEGAYNEYTSGNGYCDRGERKDNGNSN